MPLCCGVLGDCIGDDQQPQSSLPNENSASIVSSLQRCHAAAKRTVELCDSTLETGRDLVSCGESIQRSLVGAASDLSAESFAVIADLVDGDKAREATELAVTMGGKSKECISLSVEMVESLERSVDALPDIVESYVEKKAQQSMKDELTAEERQLVGEIEGDARELTACIDAIKNLRLLTAVEAGNRSFDAIKEKSKLCHRIFQMIKKFANDVLGITGAVSRMDASAVISKIKDGSILKAIGLSKYIRKFAEGCRLVMDGIVELFRCTSGRLSELWRALSHAKDVMVKSLSEVSNARCLCDEAGEKADELRRTLSSLGGMGATRLMKSLAGNGGGGEGKSRSLGDAEGTAREVDAGIGEAAAKMRDAARMVGEEYRALPPMITDGIVAAEDDYEDGDEAAAIADEFGARIRDVEGDVRELEEATRSIEESDVVRAAATIHREISDVPGRVDACRDMIGVCAEFADRSRSAIDSFLGRWSLETAVSHIKEMSRLVSLSKLMERLTDRIHALIGAIATLLRAVSAKVRSAKGQLTGGAGGGGLDSVVDAAGDFVSDGLNKLFKR